ncbi:hypothetical protein BsWGS_01746 [Bradybaena similaris]
MFVINKEIIYGQGITECVYDSNSCSCQTNKGTIDLNRASTDTPYSATNTLTGDVYYWKPCTDFPLYNVFAGGVQYIVSTSFAFSIGTHVSAFSDVKDGYARFNMNNGDSGRATYVQCVCGSGNTLVFQSEDPSYSYNFAFYSDVCCFSKSAGISAGTIIVIIIFSLLLAYFLFGTLFQTVVRKAQGIEKIPNASFWSSFPGLVKDGVIFTFTCGRRGGYGQV